MVKALSIVSIVLAALGLLFAGLFSFLGFGGVDMLLRMQVRSMLQLKEGTNVWTAWTTIPLPIYIKFRFFNITNPVEFAEGAKAKVVEMGPYTYMEDWEKVNITVNAEEDTVRYVQTKTYFFVPEMSSGAETDQVTFINVILLATAAASNEIAEDDFMLSSLDSMLSRMGEKLTRTATVREILFEGYSVQNYIDMFNDELVQAAAEAAGREIKIPESIADGKFGLFKHKNGTGSGYFVVRTGLSGPEDVGRIVSWEGKIAMDNWRGSVEDGCNAINGTDGTIRPPFLQPEVVLPVFNPQVCRTISFEYVKDSEVGGVATYQYELSPHLFEPPSTYPPNWCFCPRMKNETGTCARTGVFDLRACVGAPLLLSRPHFLGADEWILNGVEGLNPDPENHRMILEIHPFTGATVSGKVRLQFNIELIPYEAMPTFADAQNAIIPFLWMEELVDMPEDRRKALGTLDSIHQGFPLVAFGLVAVGVIMIGVGIVLLVMSSGKLRKPKSASRVTAVEAHDETWSKPAFTFD